MFATLGRAAREREAQASTVRLTARVKELTRENRVLSSKVNQLGFMLSQSYAASVGAPVPDGGAARKGGGEVHTTHCERPGLSRWAALYIDGGACVSGADASLCFGAAESSGEGRGGGGGDGGRRSGECQTEPCAAGERCATTPLRHTCPL